MRGVSWMRPRRRSRNPTQPNSETRDATLVLLTCRGAWGPQREGEVVLAWPVKAGPSLPFPSLPWLFPLTGSALPAFLNSLEFPGPAAWSGDMPGSDQACFLLTTRDPDLLVSSLAASADSTSFLHLQTEFNPRPTLFMVLS